MKDLGQRSANYDLSNKSVPQPVFRNEVLLKYIVYLLLNDMGRIDREMVHRAGLPRWHTGSQRVGHD